jgi:transcriptional regulator with XRE-family HTH domain
LDGLEDGRAAGVSSITREVTVSSPATGYIRGMATVQHPGELLREWRQRRNLSQLDLALRSAVSGRHLSFIETGRARPSREMILHLAQRLDMPLRERNQTLLAAGYAPTFSERSLDDESMAPVRAALDRFLAAHEPYPAVVVDRRWNMVAANGAAAHLTDGVVPGLLEPPANGLRATLHPDGMAPFIVNFEEWSGHLLERLRRQIEITGDAELQALYEEAAGYPGVRVYLGQEEHELVLPLQLRRGEAVLSFFSTVTTFGTALDITLAELSIEAFYPADEATAAALRV